MSSSFLRVLQLDSAAHWSTPDSRLYCAAAIIDQASASGTLQNRFSVRCRTMSARMFFCFSCFHFAFVLLPEACAWLFWSLLCSSGLDSGLLTHMLIRVHTNSWLMLIFLSAGGTVACWGRNAAWLLWKRSWGSKGWVSAEEQHQTLASDLSLLMQKQQLQIPIKSQWMLGGSSAISNKPLKHKWARMKEKGRHPASSETSCRGLRPSDGEHPGRRPVLRCKASFSKNLSS